MSIASIDSNPVNEPNPLGEPTPKPDYLTLASEMAEFLCRHVKDIEEYFPTRHAHARFVSKIFDFANLTSLCLYRRNGEPEQKFSHEKVWMQCGSRPLELYDEGDLGSEPEDDDDQPTAPARWIANVNMTEMTKGVDERYGTSHADMLQWIIKHKGNAFNELMRPEDFYRLILGPAKSVNKSFLTDRLQQIGFIGVYLLDVDGKDRVSV